METTCSLFVLGRALLVLPEKSQTTAFADLINSVLLAQLVANRKVEEDTQANWYDCYVSVLDDFWLRQSKVRYDLQISDHGSDSFFEWITQVVIDRAPEGSQYLAPALQHIAGTRGAEITVSARSDHATAASTAQSLNRPGVLVIVPQSEASFTSVFVEFTTRQQTEFNPWQRFQTEWVNGAVGLRFSQASLSEFLYRPARRAIAVKVKDKLHANLRPLDAPINDGPEEMTS